MAKLAKYLPRLGWSVSVLCADVRYPDILDPDLAAEIPPGVQVVRVRPPLALLTDRAAAAAATAYRSGRRGRVAGPLMRAARAVLVPDRWVLWSIRASRVPLDRLPLPDVVLSSGPPHSAHIAGSRLARRLGVPHVVDLRDAWAEGAFGLRVAPWQAPIDRWLERRTLARADLVVVAAPAYARRLGGRYPGLAGRVRAIPNGFDEDDVRHAASRRVPQAGDDVRFLYAGRLVAAQAVGRLFDVLATLAEEGGLGLGLRFLGQVDPHHARQSVQALGSRVRFDPPVAHRDAIAAMSAADVLVVTTAGGGMGDATLTGKLFEYLALRRPVLLIGPAGPAAELVASTRSGAFADPGDHDAMRVAIETVVAMARDPAFQGASPSELAPYTRASLAAEWAAILGAAAVAPGPSR